MPSDDVDQRVKEMQVWAWVGDDDEFDTGEVGLKQGFTPCGLIPLVACKAGKIDQPYILDQMRALVGVSGKTRYLARFTFQAVEMTLTG